MAPRRELGLFALALALLLCAIFHAALFGGEILSPGDVVFSTESFADGRTGDYEPRNRLLMDPVLQFQPWLEFTRGEIRAGRLPLWNPLVGCGSPHLANGQSAVFDPFHLVAYLGTLPAAIGWMAVLRLWVAGVGTYLLARCWGYAPAGRWLAGLSYPLCGFLMLWLLYPVASVAVWMPWLFLATDRVFAGRRFGVSGLAVVVGFTMLGGHVQTSAHVLLAVGLYAVWRIVCAASIGTWWVWGWRRRDEEGAAQPIGEGWRRDRTLPVAPPPSSAASRHLLPEGEGDFGAPSRIAVRWASGVALGLLLAAIEIAPLAAYLSRSPVWADRELERPSAFALSRPRILDAATTAFPYLFGSQRRGHPNLAKAVGVHNLNEAAGGFAGLAALIWLAPAAWSRRRECPRVRFLGALLIFGAMGAFNVFPIANLLRVIPVMNVADNRRLTLWVAFSLVMLSGVGIDATIRTIGSRSWTIWTRSWIAVAMLLVIAGVGVVAIGPRIREKSLAHYAQAAEETPGADGALYRERAERQAHLATTFLPRYYFIAAGHLLALAALAEILRGRTRRSSQRVDDTDVGLSATMLALVVLVIADLVAFGYGLNPSISRAEDRPESGLIAYLRREVPPPARVIAVGAELPPNMLMRYGLADARNYDSIELSRGVSYFDRLFEPEPDGRPARTSRRTILWEGVVRSLDRLRVANVAAIVGASAPPRGVFDRVDRVGRVWVARLDSRVPRIERPNPREIRVDLSGDDRQVGSVAETFDPGWKAEIDGRAAETFPHLGMFLAVRLSPGLHRVVFRYEPRDVRIAGLVSLAAMISIGLIAGVERTGRKRVAESWNPVSRAVRIEPISSARLVLPGLPSTEGCDADGPLHV